MRNENAAYEGLNLEHSRNLERMRNENVFYEDLNKQLAEQLAVEAFAANNTFLKNQNDSFASNVEMLRAQNDRLIVIEKTAKLMIDGLMTAGDEFTNFADVISQSAEKLEDTNASMKRILYEILSFKKVGDKFNLIDAAELTAYAENKKQTVSRERKKKETSPHQ